MIPTTTSSPPVTGTNDRLKQALRNPQPPPQAQQTPQAPVPVVSQPPPQAGAQPVDPPSQVGTTAPPASTASQDPGFTQATPQGTNPPPAGGNPQVIEVTDPNATIRVNGRDIPVRSIGWLDQTRARLNQRDSEVNRREQAVSQDEARIGEMKKELEGMITSARSAVQPAQQPQLPTLDPNDPDDALALKMESRFKAILDPIAKKLETVDAINQRFQNADSHRQQRTQIISENTTMLDNAVPDILAEVGITEITPDEQAELNRRLHVAAQEHQLPWTDEEISRFDRRLTRSEVRSMVYFTMLDGFLVNGNDQLAPQGTPQGQARPPLATYQAPTPAVPPTAPQGTTSANLGVGDPSRYTNSNSSGWKGKMKSSPAFVQNGGR